MPRRPIAPNVRAYLRWDRSYDEHAFDREVRALLAVARAAQGLMDMRPSLIGFARLEVEKLDRALARLSGAGRKSR